MDVFRPSLLDVLTAMRAKGYRVFQNPGGHDLNIVGVRTADMAANRFNDFIAVFYRQGLDWVFFAFPATTDPGTYYRFKPLNVRGAAVMAPGQYRGAYRLGMHKGYAALEQCGPVKIYRDGDLDDVVDVYGDAVSGVFGLNIHRAGAFRSSVLVDRWSAGCQVFADPDHFDFFMRLCMRARDRFGNSFTYTLLDQGDIWDAVGGKRRANCA